MLPEVKQKFWNLQNFFERVGKHPSQPARSPGLPFPAVRHLPDGAYQADHAADGDDGQQDTAEQKHVDALDHREGRQAAQHHAGRPVHGHAQHLGREEAVPPLQHQSDDAAQHEEDAHRAQKDTRLPAHGQAKGGHGRPVQGDARAQQTGAEAAGHAHRLQAGPAAAPPMYIELPVHEEQQQDAHDALQDGAGTDLQQIDARKGAGHRAQQQPGHGIEAAKAHMHGDHAGILEKADQAAQRDERVHGDGQRQEGKGEHGAADAADTGDETTGEPADKNKGEYCIKNVIMAYSS